MHEKNNWLEYTRYDGILPSEMSTAHNEALRIDFVSATYPILPSDLILCPTINVLQTWYAFFVAVTAYCLAYIDGDVATDDMTAFYISFTSIVTLDLN